MSISIESLRNDMASNTPYNEDLIKAELQKKLEEFQNSILEKSNKFIDQINDWNQNLTKMDNNLDEIQGSLKSIKNNSGLKILNPNLISGKKLTSQESNESENVPKGYNIDIPYYPNDINLSIYDQIGHQSSDFIENNEQINETPLITIIPKDGPQPNFWSKSQDYFKPQNSETLLPNDEKLQTSFLQFNESFLSSRNTTEEPPNEKEENQNQSEQTTEELQNEKEEKENENNSEQATEDPPVEKEEKEEKEDK